MKKLGLLFVFVLAASFQLSAQCNSFAKKTCIPKLSPFTHNGQLNIQQLAPGEEAELDLTLYSGMGYRILVCGQEVLGKLQFEVLDNKNNKVFDNKEHDMVTSWDFEVQSTQKMTVIVKVPPADKKTGIEPTGCATVLVGFKP